MTNGDPQTAGMLGALLGNYRIVEQLGEGGMGVVYLGRHESLGHRVAVKVLQHDLSRNADMVQRFFNEAQAATSIRNPGIVQIFDFGKTSDERAYFVMELLEGQTLTARLQQRRLDYVECCRIGRQVANVLNAAHAARIIHRDLKPDNLFLVPDIEVAGGERVKVLDFGIAKLAGEAYAAGVKTRTGSMMGTPHYMSPEQSRGSGSVDSRSDIYSLGCILFEITCGRPPFVGEGLGEVLGAHQYLEPPPPRKLTPDIPTKLAKLILQMLAKQPDARSPTMAAVGEALDEILRMLDGAPRRASTPLPTPPTLSSSTTLEASAGTSSTGMGIGKRRRHLVLGGLAAACVLVTVTAVLSIQDADSSEQPIVEDESVTAPPPREIAAMDLDPTGSAAVDVPDATQGQARLPDVGTVPQATPAAAHAVEATPSSAVQLECLQERKNQRWEALAACADRLKQLNPTLAMELQKQAAMEIRSAPRVQGARSALDSQDLKRARAELDQIWIGSSAYQRIKLRYEELENQVINDLVARLQRVSGNCEMYNWILANERAKNPPRVALQAAQQVKCMQAKPATCNHEALAKAGLEFHGSGQPKADPILSVLQAISRRIHRIAVTSGI